MQVSIQSPSVWLNNLIYFFNTLITILK